MSLYCRREFVLLDENDDEGITNRLVMIRKLPKGVKNWKLRNRRRMRGRIDFMLVVNLDKELVWVIDRHGRIFGDYLISDPSFPDNITLKCMRGRPRYE